MLDQFQQYLGFAHPFTLLLAKRRATLAPTLCNTTRTEGSGCFESIHCLESKTNVLPQRSKSSTSRATCHVESRRSFIGIGSSCLIFRNHISAQTILTSLALERNVKRILGSAQRCHSFELARTTCWSAAEPGCDLRRLRLARVPLAATLSCGVNKSDWCWPQFLAHAHVPAVPPLRICRPIPAWIASGVVPKRWTALRAVATE